MILENDTLVGRKCFGGLNILVKRGVIRFYYDSKFKCEINKEKHYK